MRSHTINIFMIQLLITLSSCGQNPSNPPSADRLNQTTQQNNVSFDDLGELQKQYENYKKSKEAKSGPQIYPFEYAQPFLLHFNFDIKMSSSKLNELPDSIQVKAIPGLIMPNKRAPLIERWQFVDIKYTSDRIQTLWDADFMHWEDRLNQLYKKGCNDSSDLLSKNDPYSNNLTSIMICDHIEIRTDRISLTSQLLVLNNATVDIVLNRKEQFPDSISSIRLYLKGSNRIRIKYTNLADVMPELSRDFRQDFVFNLPSIHGDGSLVIEAYGKDYDYSKTF